MKNIFHHSTAWVAKHKHHHHLALATLALVLAGTGTYIYRHDIAQAATYTFTQSSWAGGVTANTAVHPTNQTSWAQYSATSTNILAGAGGVSLSSTSYTFTDDGATSTSPLAPTSGGGFFNGANSSTTVSGTGSGASVGLLSNNIGWAVGDAGFVIKTEGANVDWQVTSTGATFEDTYFIDANTGWAVGYGSYDGEFYYGSIIFKTTDAGVSWSAQKSTGYPLFDVHFTDANTGWVVGELGTILKTTDGGTTWTAQTSGTTQALYGTYFTDANTGWAVGGSGTILKTANGGTTWTAQIGGGFTRLESVHFEHYYSTPGTFTSAVIDTGAQSAFTTASYTTTLNGQTITVDARSGNTATPDGSWSAWQTGIASGGSISGLSGKRYFQYRANISTSDTTITPTLDSLTINYTQYSSAGNLTSSKYDIGPDALITKLSWTASTSTTETVKFQVSSSADGSTWSNWCGPSITCDGSDYFQDANNNVTISNTSHPLRSGTGANADRYFQYKVFLASGGAVTPELTAVTVQYVVNAPPLVGNVLASQVTDTGSANYNKVVVTFDVSDSDTSSGASQYAVTPTLYEYSTNGGSSWTTISSGLSANAYSNITLTSDGATSTSPTIVWDATGTNAYANNNAKVRVTISDNEVANYSASAVSGLFTLDSKIPAVSYIRINSSTANNPITWSVTDDTALSYRISNSAFASFVSTEADWTLLSGATGVDWPTLTGSPNAETVYYQFRDAYGNGVSGTAVAPAMPASFIATDTTNVNSNTYREFLSWGIASSSIFGSYKVYYNTTGAGSSYSLLGTVTDVNQNYYTHTITTATSSTHYYKVATVSTNGDISEFTSVKSDVPDGSGSTDVTAPYIPIAGIATSSVRNTSANITFSTYTDVSLADGELATSTVRYASYTGTAPTSCPSANSVSTNTYVVNHSVYLTGLTPSTSYVFCVLAKDIAGNVSTPSSVATAGGTFTTIGGPSITGVTEREVTDISATIFWNTDTSSDSKVYYSTSASGVNGATPVTGAVVTTSGTNPITGTFYQHQIGLTGLTSGLTYYYKVVSADAVDSQLVSTDDNLGQYYSFVTLKDTTPPTITGTSTPVLAPTAAVIVWQTNEPSTSKVDYGTESGVYSKGVAEDSNLSIYHVMTLSSATNNALGSGDNTLVKETPYYYRVTSKDAANNSATSAGTFSTPADGNVTITVVSVRAGDTKDTTAPSVSNVKVSDITPFGATVSFDTSEDAVSFVEYGKSSSFGDSAGSNTWSKTHSIKLRGLTLGTEYYIKVSAVDKAGNTGIGGDQTFKTLFLSENLKDLANIDNIEQFQKEIESAIESILPSLVPPFITKPIISDITESGAKISFKTNIKAFPVVVFAEDGAYDETKENPYTGEVSDTTEKATSHELVLTGLKGNTKYHVQARGFSLPKVIGKSADVTFITKAAKIAGSILERKKDSFTVVWTTAEPTSSIVEFKDLKRGTTGRKTDDARKTSHSMKIENLPSGTAYEVNLSGMTEQGNIAEAGSPLSVTTSTDITPPSISGFKVDNALVPGRTDRIQTIVSWVTDEPGNGTVYYEEGAGAPGDTEELANKNEILDSYVTTHSAILPSLKPGTIYRLKVTSSDDSGNLGSFGPRTVITPRQTESITDIIFKNFEDSFKFLQKI